MPSSRPHKQVSVPTSLFTKVPRLRQYQVSMHRFRLPIARIQSHSLVACITLVHVLLEYKYVCLV